MKPLALLLLLAWSGTAAAQITIVDNPGSPWSGQNGTKLRVRFNSGQTWDYEGAVHHHGPMLVPGTSVGKYFHAHIKGKYEGQQVTE